MIQLLLFSLSGGGNMTGNLPQVKIEKHLRALEVGQREMKIA